VVKSRFGFEDAYSVRCILSNTGSGKVFTGEVATKLGKAEDMKKELFEDLKRKMGDVRFLCAFDSKDDVLIAQEAAVRVGVNQSRELKNQIKTDVSLNGSDPWKEFYKIL
jgi:phosphoserine phosphatase